LEAKNKTVATKGSVEAFLKKLPEDRRDDCLVIHRIMKKATRSEPKMWGASIVGYGSQHLRYETGRELDWFHVGFSPRKQDLTLYIMPGFDRFPALMKRLGKYKTGKSCLYIKRLSDVDLPVLRELVEKSVRVQRKS
jgi:hypothetical protein